MLPRASQQLGVIDIGSNTARFVIFETFAIGAVRASYEDKEIPGWARAPVPTASSRTRRSVAGPLRCADSQNWYALSTFHALSP